MHRARTTERKRCACHYAGIGVSTAGTHPVRETPSSSSASRASRAESHIPVRDLNDLLCEYLSGRIRPVAQLQRSQAILVGRDERSDVLGCKGCILQKPVDGHGGAPSEKSRRRARAIPIAAMRPATPIYLHQTDEHHLNSGSNSTRQKTHLALGHDYSAGALSAPGGGAPGRYENCSTGCKRRIAHSPHGIIRQFCRYFGERRALCKRASILSRSTRVCGVRQARNSS